jgi:hypothetical protein
MAKELALKKTFTDSGTIHGDKRPVGTQTAGEKPPGDQLLARSAFTFNQDTAVGRRYLIDKLKHITNRLRNAHNYGHTGSRDLERTHDLLGGRLSWKL